MKDVTMSHNIEEGKQSKTNPANKIEKILKE